jgi:fibronectin type III domain protein
MTLSGRGARAVAIIAAAGLPWLGIAAGTATAGATAPHAPARLVPAAHHGLPSLGAAKVLHVPDAWEMQGVSCVSATHCVAVGFSSAASTEGIEGVLVPITNGKLGKQLVSTDIASSFYGVSCVSATECVVAGESEATSTSNETASMWLWKHGKLAYIRQTTATKEISSQFRGVDCYTATACQASGLGEYFTKTHAEQPSAVFGQVSLKGSPTDYVVLNTVAGYGDGITCPTLRTCYMGGSTAAGGGELIRDYLSSKGYDLHGVDQPTVSGLEDIACISVTSCEAAEVQELSFPNPDQGWVEHLRGFVAGTPQELVGSDTMFGIATVNSGYYISVGYSGGDTWLTDLISASGKTAPIVDGDQGYLQGVTCPVQTECVAVGFTTDSAKKQPGGQKHVDGAIAIYHLKTAPAAPKVKVTSIAKTSAKVRMTAPSSDGDVTISSYDLAVSRCKPHHKTCTLEAVKSVKVHPSTLTVTVSGLKAHTTYYFAATATNSVGTGPASAEVHKKTK